MYTQSVKTRIRDLSASGWVPNRLACQHDGKLVEIMSYPFASDDGESILVMGRFTPGNPTTNSVWILQGEKIRETDDQRTGLRDLRIVSVVCPKCKHKWEPKCTGDFAMCRINCPKCLRTCYAKYDNSDVTGFAFHDNQLIISRKKWRANNQ